MVTEPAPPRFRTKTGDCTVRPDRLVLTRAGVRGSWARSLYGGGMIEPWLPAAVLGAALAGVGLWGAWQGTFADGLFDLTIGGLLVAGGWSARRDSGAMELRRNELVRLEVHPPAPPALRGFFVVWFREHGGRLRRRYVLLPGVLAGGDDAYRDATRLLNDAGWLEPGVAPPLAREEHDGGA